jgi:hypothetical protein
MPLPTNRRSRPWAILVLALFAALVACRDEGPRNAASARLVGPVSRTIQTGQDLDVEIECLDADGRPIRSHGVRWLAAERQVADLRPMGRIARVRAMHVGSTFVYGACRAREVAIWEVAMNSYDPRLVAVRIVVDSAPVVEWEIDLEGDTVALRAPTALDSTTGVRRLLTVRGRTVTGEILAPDRFSWVSDSPSVATITPDGLLTAVSEGTTRLTITGLGTDRAVVARVSADPPPSSWDVAITDAHWTQGVQDERQSVPIFREGRAAVVNVLAFATADAPATRVALYVRNASQVLIWSDTALLTPSVDSLPTFAAPSAQFLVPRSVVNNAAEWRLERDTSAGGEDALGANDRLPRSGHEPLRAVTPPVLKLHLVPIRLYRHGNLVTPVNPETVVYYDSIARIRLPIGRVEISIGSPLSTDADFFTEGGSTTAGDTPFFSRVLEEIDGARVAHPTRSGSIWVGVIPRPAGVTSRWAGMAYFPSSPTLSGPLTRSQVVLGHDAYASPFTAGRLVAHELGHNFGREHAPCGNVGWADQRYPLPGGHVGRWLHWTSRWELGEVNFASSIPDSSGDLMGYCGYQWVSAYTYLGILNFRQLDGAALLAAEVRTRALIVRGSVVDAELRLSAPRVEDAVLVAPEPGSPVLIEVLDERGDRLLSHGARAGRTGDPEAGIAFAAHIAIPDAWRSRVLQVRVSAAGRSVLQEIVIP